MKKIGLYIHIPFCEKKCRYCDFYSITNKTRANAYIDALATEIERKKQDFYTVYIGGGSPSLLSARQITKIFRALKESSSGCEEFTIEANPSQITEEKLYCWLNAGVTRISIGVQSFNDRLLKYAGRIHNGEEASYAVRLAKQSGFKNISLDLMYGLPFETVSNLKEDIYKAAELSPTHISAYSLMVEENTPLFKLLKNGKLKLPPEEAEEEMYDVVNEMLPAFGYKRYEVSNFAKKGYECKHNLLYWSDEEYIGIGSTAASFTDNIRYKNNCTVDEYIFAINNNLSVNTVETRTKEDALFEYVFLALRKTEGLNTRNFQKKFNADFENVFKSELDDLKEQNLIFKRENQICLTEKGFKFSNTVFEKFIR